VKQLKHLVQLRKKRRKKDEKKESKKEEFRVVYLKDKITLDQYLKEEAPKSFTRFLELAKKAEDTEVKKSMYFEKLKSKMHKSQLQYYPSPDEVKAKWKKWHDTNDKHQSDPVSFFRNLLVNSWNKEKQDREKKMSS